MTPEQEILADALATVGQRVDRFAHELEQHRAVFPLTPSNEWGEMAEPMHTQIAAFSKRYEMTQDQVVRKLFRSVAAVNGVKYRTRALGDLINMVAELGIIDDADEWHEITKIRNALAHDYVLSPAALEPIINRAWELAPQLIAVVRRVEQYVIAHDLLRAEGESDG